MDQAEVDAFLATGRNDVTVLGQAHELLQKFAQSFEARGGAPTYGNECLEIVYLANDLKAWFTPERAAVVARLRTDV